MYPYYKWAVHTDGTTRRKCPTVVASGPTTENCSDTVHTIGYDSGNTLCTTLATASRCHGLVFFGPGTNISTLVTGADIGVSTAGNPDIRCVGQQRELSTAQCYNGTLTQSDSKVIYVMGKITVASGAVQGTVVLHGDGPGSSTNDFGLTGQSQVTTHPCPAGSPAPSPGCGYPLAILGYNPNEAEPTVATGQSMQLDLSNNGGAVVSGLIYTGGTADFSPLTVNGGLIGHDMNITNTASRITYNETYGNAAPPPAFTNPTGGSSVQMFPATWVHCTYYANESSGAPTPCS